MISKRLLEALLGAEIDDTQERCLADERQGRGFCPLHTADAQDEAVRELSWKWAHRVIGLIGLACLAAAVASRFA
jgi:hypothetical protein